MKIAVLDADTIGSDVSLEPLYKVGEPVVYRASAPDEVSSHIGDADVVILNKVKLNESNLASVKNLKLICVAATGYDNVDVAYCKTRGIGVCNVVGYSTGSVAMMTFSLALSLLTHLGYYDAYVKSGRYSGSGAANCLFPAYNELAGKTWGVVGLGNIGKKVAQIAKAFGCRVLAFKRTPDPGYECVPLETLLRESDVVSLHVPLSDSTFRLIGEKELALMKNTAVLINVARGSVTDEAAVAKALTEGRIGGLGVDVYSKEPFPSDHPYNALLGRSDAVFTPHNAWGAYEARVRVLDEMIENIVSFKSGGTRCRVDL